MIFDKIENYIVIGGLNNKLIFKHKTPFDENNISCPFVTGFQFIFDWKQFIRNNNRISENIFPICSGYYSDHELILDNDMKEKLLDSAMKKYISEQI